MSKNVIFSGVQPTGEIHLGNYLGAIKQFVDYQKDYNSIFSIVDLHAVTVWQDPQQLLNNIHKVLSIFLACGLDKEKNIIFNQSQVPEHTQLAWLLSCTARIGWLNRMTQFKDKAGKDKEKASVGLYIYPNLMAADILLYRATHVPVGADQKQHLELSRDIAQKFNNDFNAKEFFPLPEPLIQKNISRVMSLRDGTKKMSKSEDSDYSRINIKDNSDEIIKKIKKAKTDSLPISEDIKEMEKRPEALNLINIFSDLKNKDLKKTLTDFSGKDFSYFKKELSEAIIEVICPIGKEMIKMNNDRKYLQEILKKGSERASIKAEENLKKIREIVGFV